MSNTHKITAQLLIVLNLVLLPLSLAPLFTEHHILGYGVGPTLIIWPIHLLGILASLVLTRKIRPIRIWLLASWLGLVYGLLLLALIYRLVLDNAQPCIA